MARLNLDIFSNFTEQTLASPQYFLGAYIFNNNAQEELKKKHVICSLFSGIFQLYVLEIQKQIEEGLKYY